jgi:hypothetical protein
LPGPFADGSTPRIGVDDRAAAAGAAAHLLALDGWRSTSARSVLQERESLGR